MAVDSNLVVEGETIEIEQPWSIEREVQAYQRMEAQMIREHDGEWVALFRGQALGFGATPREAVLAAHEGEDRRVRAVLHRVGEPVEPRKAPHSFRIDMPRRPAERE
jgi:hypothetical protein